MTTYTCIRRPYTNFYECIQGFHENNEKQIIDYKIISVPPNKLTFQLFKEIVDYMYIKYSLSIQYRKNLVFHFSEPDNPDIDSDNLL